MGPSALLKSLAYDLQFTLGSVNCSRAPAAPEHDGSCGCFTNSTGNAVLCELQGPSWTVLLGPRGFFEVQRQAEPLEAFFQ